MDNKLLDIYSDYLIAQNKYATATGLSDLLEGQISHIQDHIHEGCSLASIPSGLMGDLLDLNYSSIRDFPLHGLDLDPESLSQAKEYANEKELLGHCHFSEEDAWQLNIEDQFDLITSNGLNIYEPNDKRVVALYKRFYNALNESGTLITSF